MLLPGDPHRALAVAQELLEQPPQMFNHARGLWGYTGTAPRRRAAHDPGHRHGRAERGDRVRGADRARRAGGWSGSGPAARSTTSSSSATLLAAETALPADGASAALGADGALAPDPELLARLVAAGARAGDGRDHATSSTTRATEQPRRWVERGAAAVEMEAATIFRVAARRGVAAACVLGVSDVPAPTARGG